MVIRVPAQITIPDHYFLKPADVIVERVGDMARAVDRHGNVIAQSSDHAYVIQEAIDYLSALGGGKIVLGNGEFEMKRTVRISSGEFLIEGMGIDKTIIKTAQDVTIDNPFTVNTNTIIRNMTFDSNGNSTYALAMVIYKSETDKIIDYIILDNVKLVQSAKGKILWSLWDQTQQYNIKTVVFRNVLTIGVNDNSLDNGGASFVETWIIDSCKFIDSPRINSYVVKRTFIANSEFNPSAHPATSLIKDGAGLLYVINTRFVEAVELHRGTVFILNSEIYNNSLNIRPSGSLKVIVGWSYIESARTIAFYDDISKLDSLILIGNYIKPTEYDLFVSYTVGGTEINNVYIIGNVIDESEATHHFTSFNGNILNRWVEAYNLFPSGRKGFWNTSFGDEYTVKHNIGYKTENSGTATFSGDGTTTQFKIAHGLVKTPSKVKVTPASADAAGDFYVTVDTTYIYVNYLTAPPSGTDNVVLYWEAEV